MTWKLKRVNQCQKCPWRKDTNAFAIPNYDPDMHRHQLSKTIADPGSLRSSGRAMSCHEHDSEEGVHCVGWVVHQLGPGNNIPLRISMMSCENSNAIRTCGEQHECFEDTLPQ